MYQTTTTIHFLRHFKNIIINFLTYKKIRKYESCIVSSTTKVAIVRHNDYNLAETTETICIKLYIWKVEDLLPLNILYADAFSYKVSIFYISIVINLMNYLLIMSNRITLIYMRCLQSLQS